MTLLKTLSLLIMNNPIHMWGSSIVSTPRGDKLIVPYPVLRWRTVFEEMDPRLIDLLRTDLMDNYGREFKDTAIYAISVVALDLLKHFEEDIKQRGGMVFLYNPFDPNTLPPDNRRVVLFDISFSTGKTVVNGLNRLPEQFRNKIEALLFVIANDLVPNEGQDSTWMHGDIPVRALYNTSDIIRQGERNTDLIAALLTVQKAIRAAEASWDAPEVRRALEVVKSRAFQTHTRIH